MKQVTLTETNDYPKVRPTQMLENLFAQSLDSAALLQVSCWL